MVKRSTRSSAIVKAIQIAFRKRRIFFRKMREKPLLTEEDVKARLEFPKSTVTILLGGEVAPALLFASMFSGTSHSWIVMTGTICGLALSYFPRLITRNRFKQSAGSVFFHPLAVSIFLAVQWFALGRRLLGIQTSWKGRSLKPQ